MKKLSLSIPDNAPFTSEQKRVLNKSLRAVEDNLGQAQKLTGNLDASGFRIVNLGNPIDSNDAVNKRSLPAGGLVTGRSSTTIITNEVDEDLDDDVIIAYD